MNLNISIALLCICTITVPIRWSLAESSNVFATTIDVNDTQSKIRKTSSITTTSAVVSETCNDRFCYSPKKNITNQSVETMPPYKEYDQLKTMSILYGVVKLATERQLNTQCYRELNQIYDGIHRKEIWAIKALDSSAIPASGFVLGHNFWMGSMKGCEAVQKPPPLTISKRFQRFMHTDLWSSTAPFDIEYRMIYAEHRSPWQVQVEFVLERQKILHIGLCLPKSCSNEAIANLTQDYFDTSFVDTPILHDLQPNIVAVKDLNTKSNLMDSKSFQMIGLCVIFTLLMMIIAYLREGNSNEPSVIEHPVGKHPETNGIVASAFVSESYSNPPDVVMHCPTTSQTSKTLIDDVIECFSIRKNLQILTNTSKPPNAVPIVDGLKSIGCFLILMFHVYWFNHFTVHNNTMTFSYGEHALWQWISATPIIVDVFFTISGLLLSYNFLRNQSKIEEIKANTFVQNLKLFGKQLIHRYIRLTPMYLVVAGATEFFTAKLVETSPFWIQDRNDITCSKYWWRNLLYIQNMFSQYDLCINWSWSLACEMQFFILFTVLLFFYAKYPNAAKAIFCSLFGIFVAFLFAIAIFTKFTPAYDVMHSLGTDMYIAPWTRILPYIIGVGSGYAMFTFNGVMPLGEKSIKIIWTVMITIAISSHISTFNRDITHYSAAPLITFIRIFYPASISWMIIASQTGHGGTFAKILDCPIFVHVNKLSYAIYLLNPIVISILYGWQDHSTHIDPISMMVMTTGIKVITYLTAICFTIMFEIPYTNLSGKWLKRTANRKTVISTTIECIEMKKSL